MFNVKTYLEKLTFPIECLIKLYESFYYFECLKENTDITVDLSDSIAKLYHIKNLMKPQTYNQFYQEVENFILSDGAKYISLLLFSHPKKNAKLIIETDSNNYGIHYKLKGSRQLDFITSVNSNYEFLFFLKNENEVSKKIIDYWSENLLIRKSVDVFYRLQDNVGNEISLQIMPFKDFTFDISNLKEYKEINFFIGFLLKENEELKDEINISFRKYLGNSFSLF